MVRKDIPLNLAAGISHSTFDKEVIEKSNDRYDLDDISFYYFNNLDIVKRYLTLPKYGLKEVANFYQIDFGHHDALEDSLALAAIILNVATENDRGDLAALLEGQALRVITRTPCRFNKNIG